MAKIKELSDIIMRKQSPQTISEVQKIWHRVMSILYRSGGCSVKIPSSNELAREFGVARSTVRIALEKLTEEDSSLPGAAAGPSRIRGSG